MLQGISVKRNNMLRNASMQAVKKKMINNLKKQSFLSVQEESPSPRRSSGGDMEKKTTVKFADQGLQPTFIEKQMLERPNEKHNLIKNSNAISPAITDRDYTERDEKPNTKPFENKKIDRD